MNLTPTKTNLHQTNAPAMHTLPEKHPINAFPICHIYFYW